MDLSLLSFHWPAGYTLFQAIFNYTSYSLCRFYSTKKFREECILENTHQKICPASSAFVLKPIMRTFFEERRREDVNGKPAKRHLNFVRMQSTENWGQIPRDQRKSHKIRANVNPRGEFCINPTLQPISLSETGEWLPGNHKLEKVKSGEKSALRPISIDQPTFLSDLEGLALHFDFLNVGEDLGPFPWI